MLPVFAKEMLKKNLPVKKIYYLMTVQQFSVHRQYICIH